MDIKNISVSNFRGIRTLEWKVNSRVACLIGPCDSNKTTILDAIEYCLYPSWNLAIDDSDFYMTDIRNEILIKVTISGLPQELLTDQKFGLFVRGWSNEAGLNDEPKPGDEIVLTVCLRVSGTLEPQWSVVNDRSDGKPISPADRARLCMNRLTSYVDRHLSWARGSTLTRLTEEMDLATIALASASRTMRNSIDLTTVQGFTKVAETAKNAAARFGVKPKYGFAPKIDSKALSSGTSAISIHDGQIPLRAAGLGTKRLVSLGLQMGSSNRGSIVLVDEVEEGLEPFRLRNLLQQFNSVANAPEATAGQVILTTLSPIATVELPVQNLIVVRVTDGATECRQVPIDLQATVRAVPEALHARKVLVCEGRTEYGLVVGLESHWRSKGSESLSYYGTAVVEGGGDEAPKRAMELASLGYSVCFFLDSDKLAELSPTVESLTDAGVKVVHWSDAVSTEQRLAIDLPISGLQSIIDLRKANVGPQSVRDSLSRRLPSLSSSDDLTVETWIARGLFVDDVRAAIGITAKEQGWFKRIDLGIDLAGIVSNVLETIPESDVYDKMVTLQRWVIS
jgi:hypothetical protein